MHLPAYQRVIDVFAHEKVSFVASFWSSSQQMELVAGWSLLPVGMNRLPHCFWVASVACPLVRAKHHTCCHWPIAAPTLPSSKIFQGLHLGRCFYLVSLGVICMLLTGPTQSLSCTAGPLKRTATLFSESTRHASANAISRNLCPALCTYVFRDLSGS